MEEAVRAAVEMAVTYDDAGSPTRSVMKTAESMMCRTGTDEVAMPGDDYELMLEDAPDLNVLGRARAAFEAGGPVAAQCALEGNAQAKVLFELDSAYVIRSHGGSVAQAVAAVTDWANLGAAEYEQQAGVELINEIYVDTRGGQTGSSY